MGGGHTHRLPHAVADDGPAAGDTADAVVAKLQLQPAGPQAQDDPVAALMASGKEEDAFGVKGPEVKLGHQSECQHQETKWLHASQWLSAPRLVRAQTGLRKRSRKPGQCHVAHPGQTREGTQSSPCGTCPAGTDPEPPLKPS